MSVRGLAIAVALVCAGGACAPADRSSANRGGRLFDDSCATCHDGSGRGRPGHGPSLRDSTFVRGSPEVLTRLVLDGLRASEGGAVSYPQPMPAWRVLDDRDLADILSHVRGAWGSAPPVAVETVAAVRKTTEGRTRPWSRDELGALDAGEGRGQKTQ